MTIEEKAKRYDEAIIRAKSLIGDTIIEESGQHIAEVIFPELKENEDESIKEWLINLVKGHIEWLEDRIREQLSNGQVYGDELVKAKNSLAWLEKQGEKGTNGNERDIPNLEPPLTIKHAREVLRIKQNDDWSEEDKTMVEDIIEAIDTQYAVTDYNEMVNWLKSLRPQNRWKPSDEQMEGFFGVLENCAEREGHSKMLGLANSIYDDLKKLREE